MRSIQNQERVLVKFWNLSKRKAAAIWLDYRGNPIPYKILEPNEGYDVTTYVSHPWIFIDSLTGDRLMANNKFVFYPERWTETKKRLPQEHSHLTQIRILIDIMLPLYSLRDLSLQAVRDSVETKETISQLEVPVSIKTDLLRLFEKKVSTTLRFIS